MFLSLAGAFSSGGITNPFPTGEQGIFLDASDTSTLYQDAAGTTPVTAAGQPVGRWEDKSGNAYIFGQTTSTKRPLYQTAGGLHWVDFDGVDDVLGTTVNMDMTGSDEVSIFGAYVRDTATFGVYLSLGNNNIPNGSFMSGALSNNNTEELSKGTSIAEAQGGASPVGTAFVQSRTSKISTDSIVSRLNGAQVATSSGDQGSGGYSSLQMFIGDWGSSNAFNGRIYSLMVFGRLATAQEQTDIEAFMAEKAGVTL